MAEPAKKRVEDSTRFFFYCAGSGDAETWGAGESDVAGDGEAEGSEVGASGAVLSTSAA